jgi:hypothetical protein
MTTRTTETALTFRRPFTRSAVGQHPPAGAYRIAVDEDEILGLSFVAFRRTATMLHVPALSASIGRAEMFVLDADELAAAIETDRLDP